MNLDFSHLYLMFVISLVGFGYLSYGRKQAEFPFVGAGLAMLGMSYFVSSLWLAGLLAAAIAAVPFVLARF